MLTYIYTHIDIHSQGPLGIQRFSCARSPVQVSNFCCVCADLASSWVYRFWGFRLLGVLGVRVALELRGWSRGCCLCLGFQWSRAFEAVVVFEDDCLHSAALLPGVKLRATIPLFRSHFGRPGVALESLRLRLGCNLHTSTDQDQIATSHLSFDPHP